jgi:outer membrane immunogenic protein
MLKIQTRLLAIAAIAALGTAAHAADMAVKAPPPAPIPPTWSWTGFYIGVNGGGASTVTEWQYTNTLNANSDNGAHGPVVGGTFGYNWQFAPHVVVGLEGDWDWANLEAPSRVPI